MLKDVLKLEGVSNAENKSSYRTIFKTKHGRVVFLELEIRDSMCIITNCFYIDRNQGRKGDARYSAKPKKPKTFQLQTSDLLFVIKTELDKHFYGIEFIQTDRANLPLDAYVQAYSEATNRKYHFLIMVGSGDKYNNLPLLLRTRIKNKMHRSIFVELAYYNGGIGVVKQCFYYDRGYKRKDVQITPPMLVSCFFPYTQAGILNLLNHELCCDFTHMLITDVIDLDSNTTPLCGAL